MRITTTLTQIIKRDGRVESFDPRKIANAIQKALSAVGKADGDMASRLAGMVVDKAEAEFEYGVPRVEDIQDLVEQTLMEQGHTQAAKAYIVYRRRRTEVRELKRFIGVEDDLKLGVNSINVLKRRYLIKDEEGRVAETPSQLFRRVARVVAAPDANYGSAQDAARTEEEFYNLMASLEFLPNSPTLMNAGTEIGQLSACFVLPVEDSMESIFGTLKDMAIIHQSGGGTGFSFSRLRPKGAIVRSTKGVASGPVSFMRIYDAATNVIKQGGRRRGANMGILRVDHPDILEFVTAKSRPGVLENFNISVMVTDAFMSAVEKDEEYDLIDPRTGKRAKRLRARDVMDLIVAMAWQTGDPGLAFFDEINRSNPTPEAGVIESTNPCGEAPLLPYESCNLGSIDLSKMVKDEDVDFDNLRACVRSAVHFLDNVIDAGVLPLPRITEMVKANRKIGLGVMGLADMLIRLGVPYDSGEALELGERVMGFIFNEARKTSQELAERRGPFPNFKGSVWDKRGDPPQRNATVTSVAPTGTISIIAQTSSGIEPLFAIAFVREVMEGTKLVEVNPYFEKAAQEGGFYGSDLILEIARRGSIRGMDQIPEDTRRVFVTAMDIAPEWHVRMQAAFQRHCDNAVSKTVNLPREATPEDVRNIYSLAYKLKLKGITVYRYGSKPEQTLYFGPELARELGEDELVWAGAEFAGGCPTGECSF